MWSVHRLPCHCATSWPRDLLVRPVPTRHRLGIRPRTAIYPQAGVVQFARPATIANFLPLLAERFARQRFIARVRLEGKIVNGRPTVVFLCTQNAGRYGQFHQSRALPPSAADSAVLPPGCLPLGFYPSAESCGEVVDECTYPSRDVSGGEVEGVDVGAGGGYVGEDLR